MVCAATPRRRLRPGVTRLGTRATCSVLRHGAFVFDAFAWADAPVPIRTSTGGRGVIDPRGMAVAVLLLEGCAGQVYTLTGAVWEQGAAFMDVNGGAIVT